jgi:two-component system, cell cycle sensor histidine kinase and response regulator CckA
VEQTAQSHHQRETGKGETILLVDDNESVRNSLADLLRMHGYNVIPAADGFQALEVSRQRAGAIDLLITDVVMPQMNGRELADTMMSENQKMKVLFISGYDERAVSEGGRADQKIAFLAKPTSTDSLLLKIRQLI